MRSTSRLCAAQIMVRFVATVVLPDLPNPTHHENHRDTFSILRIYHIYILSVSSRQAGGKDHEPKIALAIDGLAQPCLYRRVRIRAGKGEESNARS
jgi:hypothetical protein